jgi:hypothetical protein
MMINGIEYAESNYPDYWWCWNYVFWAARDREDRGNAIAYPNTCGTRYVGGSGWLLGAEIGRWAIFLRCPCGVGFIPRDRYQVLHPTPISPVETKGHARWLCPECGRAHATLIPWVGRRVANRWEWKPESELPDDLRIETPEAAQPEDFDARVKAAAEVEVAIRMAKLMEGKTL